MDLPKGMTTNSPISISLISLLVMGGFGLFSYLSPKITSISTNTVEIKSTNERVDKVESAQDKYNELFLKISNSLSEIKGHLKGMEERRKKDE